MQCVTVWVIHFGDKLRSRQTLKGSTPFSSCWVFTLLNSLCCSELGEEELSEDELVFNSSCMSFLLQAFSLLDWSQGHYMKWGAGKRQREREREMFGERHQVYGFSGDMHKYKGLVSTIYLCANDLQRNGHYIIHWLSSVRMDSLFLF